MLLTCHTHGQFLSRLISINLINDIVLNQDHLFIPFFFVAAQQVSSSCGNKVLQDTSQTLSTVTSMERNLLARLSSQKTTEGDIIGM